MQDNLIDLEKWRTNRNMSNKEFVLDVEVSNLLEECTEYLRAKNDYERIDALCDIAVFSINADSYIDFMSPTFDDFAEYSFYEIIGMIASLENCSLVGISHTLEIIVLTSFKIINDMGYDYVRCMRETIKEISSRMQDPIQMKDWAVNGANGKWLKDPNQPESTKYKADYDSCKIVSE
jgi:hypothetical protein